MECETVKIAVAKTIENPNGYVVINKSDFDDTQMKLFGEAKVAAPVAPMPELPVLPQDAVKAPWEVSK